MADDTGDGPISELEEAATRYSLEDDAVSSVLAGDTEAEVARRVLVALAFANARPDQDDGLEASVGRALLDDDEMKDGRKLATGLALAGGSLEATGRQLLAIGEDRGGTEPTTEWLEKQLDRVLSDAIGTDGDVDSEALVTGVKRLITELLGQPRLSRQARAKLELQSFRDVEAVEAVETLDDGFDRPGVLLADKIEAFRSQWDLIHNFERDNLKPAGYKLRIGDEYSMHGETHELSEAPENNEIKIPPFEVVVIETAELVNMPRFLIGRMNITVDLAQKGLLWVGGPQVDPGYVGYLYCPLYNLSDRPVRLTKGEGFCVIDFHPTTKPPGDGETPEWYYPRPPGKHSLDDYDGADLRSGLSEEAKKRVDDVEKDVERVSQLLFASLGAVFTVLAILIAALSVFLSQGSGDGGVLVVQNPLLFLGLVLIPAAVLLGLTVLFRR